MADIPAISGLIDASAIRVMLYQSGRQVHAPIERIGLLPGLTPQMFGAVGDGAANDTFAVQLMYTVAGLTGRRVYFPAGNYLCTANINVPIGNLSVDTQGEGLASIITFSGAAVDKGLYYNGVTAYARCGAVRDIALVGANGALRGLTAYRLYRFLAERVYVVLFKGAGMHFDETLMSAAWQCQFGGCGSATEGTVCVDNSTTWLWNQNYISGKDAAGTCGLMLDQTGGVAILGGAIESTLTCIKAASKTGRTVGVSQVGILGIDMENPGNNPFISVGNGWDGAASSAGINWNVQGCVGSASGSAQIDHAVWLEDCFSMHFNANHMLPTGTPVATHWLQGTANIGVVIGPHANLVGAVSCPWVMVNGAQRKDASPRVQFNQAVLSPPATLYTEQFPITGTTASLMREVQGGYFHEMWPNNGGATNLATITDGVRGAEVTLIATNGNTTIVHGVGASAFNTRGAANFVMAAGLPYRFRHTGTHWAQL